MQKVVVDMNVVVSSLIQRSYPHFIISELFLVDAIQLCVSDELMAEHYEVLCRPKFARFHDFFARAEGLLAIIENKALRYQPTLKLDLISDADDNMILELVDACEADFIVTGNTTDFTFPTYEQTKISTSKEYWETYRPNF